ncbi:MAG: hypothetical protein KIT17_17585 [Rubrivivax sp.]|nr:hypothetical protein [Rubrivivax sp.]
MDKSTPSLAPWASPRTPRWPATRRTSLLAAAAIALAALANIAIGSGIALLAGDMRAPAIASNGEAAPRTTGAAENG